MRAGFKLYGTMTVLLTNADKILAKHAGILAVVFAVWTPAMALVVFERETQIEGSYGQFVRHVVTSKGRGLIAS